MKHKLFLLFFCMAIFSCARENAKSNGGSNEIIIVDAIEVPIIIDPQISIGEQRFNYFLENIEGFYSISGELFRERNESYLVKIIIENDELIIYRFTIVNNQHSYDELIRFDIGSNDFASNIRLTNDIFRFFVQFNRNNTFDRIELSRHFPLVDFWAHSRFFPISNNIEDISRFTYDYQKQHVGIFEYYSHTFFGMTVDEFNQRILPSNKIIINVGENGSLFIDDGFGNDRFDFPRFRIHSTNNEPIILFGSNPGSGLSNARIYFHDNAIFHEENFNSMGDSWESGFQFVFKRRE